MISCAAVLVSLAPLWTILLAASGTAGVSGICPQGNQMSPAAFRAVVWEPSG
jgi:hypothetical protein